MTRSRRLDYPGAIHHVCNRAIGRRTMFESPEDMDAFLGLVQTAIREGRIKVYAYCVMTTHYHLVLRSQRGELSDVMHRVQCNYSRHFNRRADRDGPLVKSRFFSKLIDSPEYFHAACAYVEHNPVEAGIVRNASEYAASSAAQRHHKSSGPLTLVNYEGRRRPSGGDPGPLARILRARLESTREMSCADHLLTASPQRIARWVSERAAQADGHLPNMVMVLPEQVVRQVMSDERIHDVLKSMTEAAAERHRRTIAVGLARELSGVTLIDLSEILGVTLVTVSNDQRRHRELVLSSDDYRDGVAELACRILATSPLSSFV